MIDNLDDFISFYRRTWCFLLLHCIKYSRIIAVVRICGANEHLGHGRNHNTVQGNDKAMTCDFIYSEIYFTMVDSRSKGTVFSPLFRITSMLISS